MWLMLATRCRLRLVVRTTGFHPVNASSILAGDVQLGLRKWRPFSLLKALQGSQPPQMRHVPQILRTPCLLQPPQVGCRFNQAHITHNAYQPHHTHQTHQHYKILNYFSYLHMLHPDKRRQQTAVRENREQKRFFLKHSFYYSPSIPNSFVTQ